MVTSICSTTTLAIVGAISANLLLVLRRFAAGKSNLEGVTLGNISKSSFCTKMDQIQDHIQINAGFPG